MSCTFYSYKPGRRECINCSFRIRIRYDLICCSVYEKSITLIVLHNIVNIKGQGVFIVQSADRITHNTEGIEEFGTVTGSFPCIILQDICRIKCDKALYIFRSCPRNISSDKTSLTSTHSKDIIFINNIKGKYTVKHSIHVCSFGKYRHLSHLAIALYVMASTDKIKYISSDPIFGK